MTACQSSSHPRTGQPAAFDLTYRQKPTAGRLAAPGITFTLAVCASCRDAWATEIEQDGGTVIGLKALAVPPAPIVPRPVGLDAIATGAVAAEG